MAGIAVPPGPSWLSRQLKWARNHPSNLIRYLIQAVFVVVITRAAYLHRLWEAADKAGPSTGASVDSLCPLGALETFWRWATTGSLLPHMHPSSLIMGLALAIAVLLLGPAFCGWVCPFGTVQEWLFKLSRKLPFLQRRRRPIKVELPGAWEKRLRRMRYVMLAAVLGFTWYLGSMAFQDYDPYRALFSLGSSEVAIGALVVLGVTTVGSLVIERFWCRYLCPLGAVNGILAKLSLVRIRREPSSCLDCNLCTQTCYANIPVATSSTVSDTACTGCLSCVEACPRPAALTLEVPLRRRLFGNNGKRAGAARQALAPALPADADTAVSTAMARLPKKKAQPAFGWSRLAYGVAVPVVILATIGVSSALGAWQTTGSTEVTMDQATGVPSIDNIKGWRTPKDVSEMFGIPLEELYAGLGIPADFPADSPLKDLEEKVPDFSVTQVRDWVTAELARKGIAVPASTTGDDQPARGG